MEKDNTTKTSDNKNPEVEDPKDIGNATTFYLRILTAQEKLFDNLDANLKELKSRHVNIDETNDEEDKPSLDSDIPLSELSSNNLISNITLAVNEMKQLFILFVSHAIEEQKKYVKDVYEFKQKENEFKEMASLFTEYQEKMESKISALEMTLKETKLVKDEALSKLKKKDDEILKLYEKLMAFNDLMIRIESVKNRRANLEKMRKLIESEEDSLLETLSSLKLQDE